MPHSMARAHWQADTHLWAFGMIAIDKLTGDVTYCG